MLDAVLFARPLHARILLGGMGVAIVIVAAGMLASRSPEGYVLGTAILIGGLFFLFGLRRESVTIGQDALEVRTSIGRRKCIPLSEVADVDVRPVGLWRTPIVRLASGEMLMLNSLATLVPLSNPQGEKFAELLMQRLRDA